MFEKQGWHLFFLLLLLAGVAVLAKGEVLTGQLWDLSTQTWLWIAITIPIIHQVYVWLVWRLQLHHGSIKRAFGNNAFPIYKIGFAILFVGRPISLILVGIANNNTMTCNPIWVYLLALVAVFTSVYGMYSVVKYFGINRAFGIDHFEPEIYGKKPFVKAGIFKYTDNAMYKFVFLIFWGFALAFLSKAALLVAAFNHLYIWVHYYFTELPDIRHIYRIKGAR